MTQWPYVWQVPVNMCIWDTKSRLHLHVCARLLWVSRYAKDHLMGSAIIRTDTVMVSYWVKAQHKLSRQVCPGMTVLGLYLPHLPPDTNYEFLAGWVNTSIYNPEFIRTSCKVLFHRSCRQGTYLNPQLYTPNHFGRAPKGTTRGSNMSAGNSPKSTPIRSLVIQRDDAHEGAGAVRTLVLRNPGFGAPLLVLSP